MAAQVRTFFDEATFTATHVAFDASARRAAIIDSVLDYDCKAARTATRSADRIIEFVKAKGLVVDWILETHVHADHLTAAQYLKAELGGQNLKAELGGQIAIGARVTEVQETFGGVFNEGPAFKRDGSQFDHLFEDGETFEIGAVQGRVVFAPGHTPSCVVYCIGDTAFVGDTIFMPDFGTARTDFPGGDARTLYRSIQAILSLKPETRLFVGHDYKASPHRDDFAWETSVAAQKRENIHVRDGVSEDDFVAMREARDKELDAPALILPALQVNMRAGHFPPPEDNGVSYLKAPLNVI